MLDCALIIVDHEGAVEYRNRHAAALLKSGRAGLSLARSAVTAKAHALREQLMEAIRRACASEQRTSAVCVPEPGTSPDLWPRMVVVPIVSSGPIGERRAAIWILNNEPQLPDEDLLAALFRLSRAEARLAIGLLKGLSVAECAQESGVGVATIRSQLHSIFSKTGVRRQAQLVALLSRVPALRSPSSR
jgi:DNA-binding CsgD family transcriptional regulator